MQSYAWSEGWGVAPSALLVFFSAFEQICTETGTKPPDQGELLARSASEPERVDAAASWGFFLAALGRRAAREVLTVYDVALEAWADDGERIRAVCEAIDYAIGDVEALLRRLAGVCSDDPPPLIAGGPARFAVVIEGDDYADYSNKYATFEDAQYVLRSLSADFFGTERPPKLGHVVFTLIQEHVVAPRAIFIREL